MNHSETNITIFKNKDINITLNLNDENLLFFTNNNFIKPEIIYSCIKILPNFKLYFYKRKIKKIVLLEENKNKIIFLLKQNIKINILNNNKKKNSFKKNKKNAILDSEENIILKAKTIIHKYKILDKKEEDKYVSKLIDKTNPKERKKAINKLVLSNLRMSWDIAKRYKNRGVNMLDLFLSTIPGSIKALERYKKAKNCKPQTYMFWWSRQSTGRYTYDNYRLIREPVHREEQFNKMQIFKRNFFNKYGKEPSIDEIIKYLNKQQNKIHNKPKLTREKIRRISQLKTKVFSLDKSIQKAERNCLHELLIDEDAHNDPKENYKIKERINIIIEEINNIQNPLSKNIVLLRLGILNGKQNSIKELSEKFKLKQKKIRQIVSNTIKQLKNKLIKKKML